MPPSSGLQAHATVLGCLNVGSGESNLCPHAFQTSTLSTELSLQSRSICFEHASLFLCLLKIPSHPPLRPPRTSKTVTVAAHLARSPLCAFQISMYMLTTQAASYTCPWLTRSEVGLPSTQALCYSVTLLGTRVSPWLYNKSLYMEGEPMTCYFVGTRSERGGRCLQRHLHPSGIARLRVTLI